MKQLQYILLLAILVLCGCSDDNLAVVNRPSTGTARYRFLADIENPSLETRVSLDPDSHGHGDDHKHNLALHWEEDDEVVLTADDDTTKHYTFKAVKYYYDPATKSIIGEDEADEHTETLYIFESTDKTIPSPFTGTAVYRPSDSLPTDEEELKVMKDDGTIETKKSPVFKQSTNGDTQHLKCCQSMSARLENVDLTQTPNQLAAIDVVQKPILFAADGEYAYLKIELNKFYYPIYGNGKLFLYDMDETTPIDNNEDLPEYETPIAMMTFGTSTLEYINVPKYSSDDDSMFDTDTHYYLGDDYVGTFYLPVRKYAIKSGHYLAAVLQCGKYGDLYVYEKKVAHNMTFEPGELYTLDYTDKRVEYAVKFGPNTYFRSTFLEQDEGCTNAPRYNMKGQKVSLNTPSQYNNRFAYPDGGNKWLNESDIRSMRLNHGAFIQSGADFVSIYPNEKLLKWKMASNTNDAFPKENSRLILQATKKDGSIWKIPLTNYQTTDGDIYHVGAESDDEKTGYYMTILCSDTSTVKHPESYKSATYSYMQKITKGVINPSSDYSAGRAYLNCIEYVLQDRFDPVLHSSVTSKLWRTPYATNITVLCHNDSKVKLSFLPNESNPQKMKVSASSGHCICLPYLLPYVNSASDRSSRFDGEPSNNSGYNLGTWIEYTKSREQCFASKSVKIFGASNPAYFQGLFAGPGSSSTNGVYTLGYTQKFDMALPILPVFRWKPDKKESEDNYFIPWTEVSD